MSYDNTNSGAVFVNDKKKGANSPDRTGNAQNPSGWIAGMCRDLTPPRV